MAQDSPNTAFERLLSLFDSNRDVAGIKYEELRIRLTRFFEWRNCDLADELTDRVFDRVTAKITQGERIDNINAYAATVAQFIYKEYFRDIEKRNQLVEDSPAVKDIPSQPAEDEIQVERQNCLDKCLAMLGKEDRDLILAYYNTDERTMIASRKRLAEKMGATPNSLRIRACRIKAKLESCVRNCCK